jgi:hypothetical protein
VKSAFARYGGQAGKAGQIGKTEKLVLFSFCLI